MSADAGPQSWKSVLTKAPLRAERRQLARHGQGLPDGWYERDDGRNDRKAIYGTDARSVRCRGRCGEILEKAWPVIGGSSDVDQR
jgi:hypothetical protein